jgi:hypothetical protein
LRGRGLDKRHQVYYTESTNRTKGSAKKKPVYAINHGRPWSEGSIENGATIFDWHGEVVARIATKGKSAEWVKATRALIVRRVNQGLTFDAMVGLLNRMVAAGIGGTTDQDSGQTWHDQLVSMLKNAQRVK